MKDYSLDYDSYKTFILNYSIEDDQIIANLAMGEKYVIPYTVNNERKLLERMKEQFIKSRDCEIKEQKNFERSWKVAIFNFLVLIFNIYVLATGSAFNNVVIGLCAGWFALSDMFSIYNMISSKSIIRDIEKSRMFMDNERKLTDNTRINQNVLANVSKKTQELVAATPEQKPIFTLNSIDKISNEELKQIIENIEREEKFGFEYPETQDEKPMILSKKRK